MPEESVKIAPLDQDNYATWAKQMKFLLVSKGFWSAVRPPAGAAVPADVNDKAVALIGLHVADHHLDMVDNSVSAEACWTSLENLYRARSNARQLQLRQELNSIKKGAGESVSVYVGRARQLWRDLTACGVTMTEHEVTQCLLAGLPSEYDILVTVLEIPNQALTMDTVLPRLLTVEQRSGRVPGETKALLSKPVLPRAPKSKDRDKSKHSSKPVAKVKTKGKCWHCGEPGHHRQDCPKLKSESSKVVAFVAAQVSDMSDYDACDVWAAVATQEGGLDSCWVLDSGATLHMTPNKGELLDYKPLEHPITVAYGNKGTGTAVG